MKKRLITSALPYVNNIPHLGNLTQVLSADVFARFCRLRGYETLYICGTDEYGTASETKALQEGVSPRELCDYYHKIHREIYSWFNIAFDYFGRTSTEKQTEIVQSIFKEVDKNGYISEETTEQLYCPECKRFLADRYVVGTCPHCGYESARGDQCDKCGTLLDPTELINPKCVVCGHTPVLKETKNLYLDLPKALPMLKDWMNKASREGFWAKNAISITEAWMRDGLQKRCITRDLKWGIPVPKKGFEDKVFYVWFDAPIGYISITANYTNSWEYWWKDNENTELFQFIGKDNIPFHTVIFPSTLLATKDKWTLLYHMSSTEYLNYEGGKFSKSRGVGIFGNDVQNTGIPADVWRFYMFYNRPEKFDVNFSWKDFQEKANKELIGNLSNLVNRTLTFISRFYEGNLGVGEIDEYLLNQIKEKEDQITSFLEKAEERDALRTIFELSDIGNKAFQAGEPWKMRTENPEGAKRLLRTILCLVRDLGIMITPFMPTTGERILSFLSLSGLSWSSLLDIKVPITVSTSELLFEKLDDKKIEELKLRYSGTQEERNKLEEKDEVLDTFSKKVILKSAKINKVEKHPEGDKLYILTLDDGANKNRVIVSSIVPYYKADELLGQNIILVSNLKPANFRGVKSNGMLLAASDKLDNTHSTCEVIFVNDIPVGTVLEYEGEPKVKKEEVSIKAELFFSLPLETQDGYLKIKGKKILGDNKEIKVKKYINGNVG